MIIDAHHHLWRIRRGDYGWLTRDAGFLYRDFEPEHFMPVMRQFGISHSVLIQAAPTVAESRFLLELADRHPQIAAVVGWVDFADPRSARTLDELAAHPKFRGVRPMIQDLPDDDWMLRPELRHTFESLSLAGLRFDALVQPRHLANLIEIASRYPQLQIAINHCGKPELRDWSVGDADFKAWARHMGELARNPRVFCKFSALPTRAAPGWTQETFAPYVDVLMAAFGPDRLMWASDWPVLERNGEYGRWLEVATALIAPPHRPAVFGSTATAFYGLNLS